MSNNNEILFTMDIPPPPPLLFLELISFWGEKVLSIWYTILLAG